MNDTVLHTLPFSLPDTHPAPSHTPLHFLFPSDPHTHAHTAGGVRSACSAHSSVPGTPKRHVGVASLLPQSPRMTPRPAPCPPSQVCRPVARVPARQDAGGSGAADGGGCQTSRGSFQLRPRRHGQGSAPGVGACAVPYLFSATCGERRCVPLPRQASSGSRRPVHYHPAVLLDSRRPVSAWSPGSSGARPTSAASGGVADASGHWRRSAVAQHAGSVGVSKPVSRRPARKPEVVCILHINTTVGLCVAALSSPRAARVACVCDSLCCTWRVYSPPHTHVVCVYMIPVPPTAAPEGPGRRTLAKVPCPVRHERRRCCLLCAQRGVPLCCIRG